MRCVRKPPNERPLTDGTTAASAPSARARKSTSPVHSIVVWPRSHRTASMLRRSDAWVGHVCEKGEKTAWAAAAQPKQTLRRLSDFPEGYRCSAGQRKPRGRRLSQGDRNGRRREGGRRRRQAGGTAGPDRKNAQAAEGFSRGGDRRSARGSALNAPASAPVAPPRACRAPGRRPPSPCCAGLIRTDS